MYYIVKQGEVLSTISDLSTHQIDSAKSAADNLHELTGDHYHVIKVETVWTTKTLDEAMRERGDRNLAKFTEESNAYHARRDK